MSGNHHQPAYPQFDPQYRQTDEHTLTQSVAIVAQTGRFPGAEDVTTFWQKLVAGEKGFGSLSEAEITARGVPDSLAQDSDFVNIDTHLSQLDAFDAAFFGINNREAKAMDPQHRMMLESTLNLLREAAIAPEHFDGDIGLFAGVGFSQYLLHNIGQNPEQMEALGESHTVIGNYLSYACTRVAHFFNFTGPVVALDTACSSSLLSVHLACKALLNYECDFAVAGGVQLNMPQFSGYLYEEGGFRSPDGECRTFDNHANGTVFGSGLALLALRRFEDALEEGDRIIALIRGSAINNDGSDKVGFTAPSVNGQQDVIEKALAFADIDAATIGYVEAHGTGTPLGDPIELRALSEAYGHFTDNKQYCAIGSLKPAFSHMETASGAASLIKAALMLAHKILPGTLNYTAPNDKIGFENTPFFVNSDTRPWHTNNAGEEVLTEVRRAAVSSFGIGGSNAHVILEAFCPAHFEDYGDMSGDTSLVSQQAQAHQDNPAEAMPHLLLLSAKSDLALAGLANNSRAHLTGLSEPEIRSLSWHLKHNASEYPWRGVAVGQNRNELQLDLGRQSFAKHAVQYNANEAHELVFMFPGQGVQYLQMGRELYLAEPIFKHHLDQCAGMMSAELGSDLLSVLFPQTEAEKTEAEQKLQQTAFVQPAIFSVEYALAHLWLSKGAQPAAMIGHSLGEYVAACLSGVFSLLVAVKLICARAKLMQSAQAGAMTAVSADLTSVETLLREAAANISTKADENGDNSVEIAAKNAKNLFVVSGGVQGIEAFEAQCRAKEISFTRLNTSHAYHSAMMEQAAAAYKGAFADIISTYGAGLASPNTFTIPFISCVNGDFITLQQACSADYWVTQMRNSVNFAAGLDALSQLDNPVFLEVGPGAHLKTLVRKQLGALPVISCMPAKHNQAQACHFFMNAIGQCWQHGIELDWDQVFGEAKPSRLPLPPYAFQRKRYWVSPSTTFASDAQPGENFLPAPQIQSPGLMDNAVANPQSTQTNGSPHSSETKQAGKDPAIDPLQGWFQTIAWRSESLQNTLRQSGINTEFLQALTQSHSQTDATTEPLFLVFDDGSESAKHFIAELDRTINAPALNESAINQASLPSVTPVIVSHGASFRADKKQANTTHFSLQSGDATQMQQLFAALASHWQAQLSTTQRSLNDCALCIVNFWPLGLSAVPDNQSSSNSNSNSNNDSREDLSAGEFAGIALEPVSDIAVNDFMHLAQCAIELPLQSVNCVAVTMNANRVLGNEPVNPHAAMVESSCKVICHEMKEWRFMQIDTDSASLPVLNAVIASVLVDMALINISQSQSSLTQGSLLQSPAPLLADSVDPAVVLRHNQRWVKQYQQEQLPAPAASQEDVLTTHGLTTKNTDNSLLRHAGTYLITGGFGGIGYALASHLASQYKATLILLGRTDIPLREQWDAMLTAGQNEDLSEDKSDERSKVAGIIGKIKHLEELGAKVIPIAADIASYQQLSEKLNQCNAVKQCNGVFHGAGLAWSASLFFSKKADVAKVFTGKVQGAINLERYFSERFQCKSNIGDSLPEALDFVTHFSSIWSVTGGPGLLAYTAANRFLDALGGQSASQQNSQPSYCKHRFAINWSGWAQVGMAADLFKTEQEQASAIQPGQGIAALERVMQSPLSRYSSQIIVAPDSASVLGNKSPDLVRSTANVASAPLNTRADNASVKSTDKNTGAEPTANLSASLENETEQTLAVIWQEVLGVDGVNADDNFFDLGGSSLLLSEVLKKVKQRIKADVKIIDLLNYPTIRAQYTSLFSPEQANDSVDDIAGDIANRANKRREQARKRAGRGSARGKSNDSQVPS